MLRLDLLSFDKNIFVLYQSEAFCNVLAVVDRIPIQISQFPINLFISLSS